MLARAPLAAAWLYGSRARDGAAPGADVDLALLLASHGGAARRRTLDELARELAAALGTARLSLVDLERVPLLLRHRVLRDGLLLLDADPRRRGRFAARTLERWVETRALRRVLDDATLRRLARGAAGGEAVPA